MVIERNPSLLGRIEMDAHAVEIRENLLQNAPGPDTRGAISARGGDYAIHENVIDAARHREVTIRVEASAVTGDSRSQVS